MLVLVGCFALPTVSSAEDNSAKYEYAVVKWDGPDRLFYNLPDKFEVVHLEKTGVTIPKEANGEEYSLPIPANKMAKGGGEAVILNSRRILFRRATIDANGKPIKR